MCEYNIWSMRKHYKMIRISLVQLPLQFFFRYLDNVGIAGLASQSDKAIEN